MSALANPCVRCALRSARTNRATLALLIALITLAMALAGCGGSTTQPPAGGVTISVTPISGSVAVSKTQQFTATVSGSTNTAVTWLVNNVAGGNSTLGTISASGAYTAPSSVPTPATVTITAQSAANTSKTASAQVTITATASVAVSVAPASASVALSAAQQFAATVTGTSNTAVTWAVNGTAGGNATVGTISSSGLYTAPATLPSNPTVTVSAASMADSTKSASASVGLTTAGTVFDQYGGLLAKSCTGGSKPHFYTEVVNGAWRFCTPDGHAFFYQAVYVVDSDSRQWTTLNAKYGDHDITWGPQQNRRLKSWGFNVIGPYSNGWVKPTATYPTWPGGTQPVKLPWVAEMRPTYYGFSNNGGYASEAFKNLIDGTDSHYTNYRGNGFPDIYDPKYLTYFNGRMAMEASAYGWDSPWTIGINIDDTDELEGFGAGPDWGSAYTNPHLGYIVLITAPSQTSSSRYGVTYTDTKVYSKYALRDFLMTKYTTIAALNAAWGASYTSWDSAGGWGTGTGLLDENGRNPWLCPDNGTLSGCTPGMKTDLDNFQYEIARKYFTTVHNALKAAYPDLLYLGPSAIGSWSTPAYANVLRASQGQVDVIATQWLGDQAQLDWDAQYGGDVPIISWLGYTANPDSDMSAYSHTGDYTTQALRGQAYYDGIAAAINQVATPTGHKPYAGFQYWQLYDNITENANWGLISLLDNPYDGTSATIAAGKDQWGYPTGGESANYGDFLTKVKQANALWMQVP